MSLRCALRLCEKLLTLYSGGDCLKDNLNGNLNLKHDQSPNSVIAKSVMASHREQKPVGLVIGKRLCPSLHFKWNFNLIQMYIGSKNQLLKVEIPHRYCVMDWFLITNVWMEKMGKYAGFRIRFEKLDLSTKGWWAEQESDEPLPSRKVNRPPPERVCRNCGESSLQVYRKPGWMCLTRSCPRFWKFGNNEPTDLEYHPHFLNYRHPRGPDILNPGPLADLVDRNIEPSEGLADREEWRGIVCPHCRKCIQRVTWDAWDCSNDVKQGPQETCCYKVVRKMREISLQTVLEKPKPYSRAQCSIEPVIDKDSLKPYEVRTYEMPGVGSITHFVSNATISERPNGPNHLFSQLQKLDLGLRRYPLGSAQGKKDKAEETMSNSSDSDSCNRQCCTRGIFDFFFLFFMGA